jgi:hypothetical protein
MPFFMLLLAALLAPLPLLADAGIKLSGEYYYRTDAETLELMGERVCFLPDPASADLLLKPAGIQDLWFCFEDVKGAKKAFGIPAVREAGMCKYHGPAVIRISGYHASQMEGDAEWNTARLEKVFSHSAPQKSACD